MRKKKTKEGHRSERSEPDSGSKKNFRGLTGGCGCKKGCQREEQGGRGGRGGAGKRSNAKRSMFPKTTSSVSPSSPSLS